MITNYTNFIIDKPLVPGTDDCGALGHDVEESWRRQKACERKYAELFGDRTTPYVHVMFRFKEREWPGFRANPKRFGVFHKYPNNITVFFEIDAVHEVIGVGWQYNAAILGWCKRDPDHGWIFDGPLEPMSTFAPSLAR